jgi:hypothetical protein
MKQKLLLLAILIFTITSQSQVKDEEEKKDTGSKIKVYTPTGSLSKNTKNDNSYKWAIKTDMFAYVVGEFPLSFEYRLSKKFAVEAAVGATYSFIPNTGIFEDESNDKYDDGAKAAIGSVFRGTLKFYPSSDYDAIEGWNFGIQLFSKTNNREYGTENSSDEAQALVGKTNKKTKTGISLIIGKQIFQDSNIAFESYIGVGFANTIREFTTVETIFNNDGANTFLLVPQKIEETAPNFQLGFKIGFGN